MFSAVVILLLFLIRVNHPVGPDEMKGGSRAGGCHSQLGNTSSEACRESQSHNEHSMTLQNDSVRFCNTLLGKQIILSLW